MKITETSIASVIPYARNPRKNAAAVSKVAASLKEYGFRQPIVCDEAMVVIAGHTRLQAAQSLGMKTVPVHIASGLSKAQIAAYRIADNRTGQEAEWDNDLLAVELAALAEQKFDLSLTGFNPDELDALLNPPGILPEADLDAVPEAPAEPITKLGDRITPGRHALVCGDSTDTLVWDALLAGRQAGMIWTDPPYGVSYVGKTKDALTIENDNLAEGGLEDFLRSVFALAWANSRAGAAWYVAAPAGPQFLQFAQVLTDLKVWRQTLVWVKSVFVLGRSDYHYRHEPIFEGGLPQAEDTNPLAEEVLRHDNMLYGWKEGAAHTWNGGRKQDTVLEFKKPKANREHPTMKPVALIQRCIENNSPHGCLVVDPFGGSGSTLIAAEASGYASALIELSPAYCDVIVKRWETATGQQAVRP